MKRNNEIQEPSGPISYGRLVFQAIPELFSYQMISGILLAIATWGLYKLLWPSPAARLSPRQISRICC